MPAFLVAALEWIAETALVKLGQSLIDFIKQKVEDRRRRNAAEDEAKASVDPLKRAQTGKEIDDAARDSADGI